MELNSGELILEWIGLAGNKMRMWVSFETSDSSQVFRGGRKGVPADHPENA